VRLGINTSLEGDQVWRCCATTKKDKHSCSFLTDVSQTAYLCAASLNDLVSSPLTQLPLDTLGRTLTTSCELPPGDTLGLGESNELLASTDSRPTSRPKEIKRMLRVEDCVVRGPIGSLWPLGSCISIFPLDCIARILLRGPESLADWRILPRIDVQESVMRRRTIWGVAPGAH
jgi:hypothetical protein